MKTKFFLAAVLVSVFIFLPNRSWAASEIIDIISSPLSIIQNQAAELNQQLTQAVSAIGIPIEFNFEKNLKYGDSGNEVKYLQSFLKTSGLFCQDCDTTGFFGNLTKRAVSAFQEKYASEILVPWGETAGTGFVGKNTKIKLNNLLASVTQSAQTISLAASASLPTVYTNSATNIQPTQTQLNSNLSSLGGETYANIRFQWGESTTYDKITPVQKATTTGQVNAVITGLTPGKTYYFRAIASNGQGTFYGTSYSFQVPYQTISSANFVGKYLVYAETYRTTDSRGKAINEWLALGDYAFTGNSTGTLRYFLYDANKNYPPGNTQIPHNAMDDTPYGGTSCSPGSIKIPAYVASYADPTTNPWLNFTWWIDNNLLKIKIGTVIHEWRLEDPATGFYKRNKPHYDYITGKSVVGGLTYSNSISYGYINEGNIRLASLINKDSFLNSYKGDLYQNNKVAGSEWTYYNSGLSTNLLTPQTDSDVLGYDYACPYAGQSDTWCQSTMLLNFAPYSKSFIYLNGGHDFNLDGCYNESSHSLTTIGIQEEGKIVKMVFIEQSYETDGFPIINVGRYYAP